MGDKIPLVFSVASILGLLTIILVLVLTLPETYSCDPSNGNYYVKTFDPPVIDTVSPFLVCSKSAVKLHFTGSNFLRLNGEDSQLYLPVTDLSVTGKSTDCFSGN